MSGTDFTRPVRVRTLRQDTLYDQFQNAGSSGPGNFIARPGTRPTEIGLGSSGRSWADGSVGPKEVVTYNVPRGTRVLESTASAKDDFWSVGSGNAPGGGFYELVIQPSVGGGQQTLIGNKGVMQAQGPATSANPALLEPNTPRPSRRARSCRPKPPRRPTPPSMVVSVDFYRPNQAIGVGAGTPGAVGTDPDRGRRERSP